MLGFFFFFSFKSTATINKEHISKAKIQYVTKLGSDVSYVDDSELQTWCGMNIVSGSFLIIEFEREHI